MLAGLRAFKNTLLGQPEKPAPLTSADKEAEAQALLVDAVTPHPPKRTKKGRKKQRAEGQARLATAVDLLDQAQKQRPDEVSDTATAKTAALQHQVDDVTGIMNDNVRKLLSRGEKLESIQARSDDLIAQSAGFHKKTKVLKRDLEVKNLILTLVIVGLLLGLLAGGYICAFYGIFSKYAVPTIAGSMVVGGAAGGAIGYVVNTIYTLFKDSPLFNSSNKPKSAAVNAMLHKATSGITHEVTFTDRQRQTFEEALSADHKPVLSFQVTQPLAGFTPKEKGTMVQESRSSPSFSPS